MILTFHVEHRFLFCDTLTHTKHKMPGGIVVDWEEEAKNFPEFTKGDIEVFHEAFQQFDAGKQQFTSEVNNR